MDFVFANDLGITLDLIVLRTDSQPFIVYMNQHQGEFLATPDKLGNVGNVSPKFTYFFTQARTKNADLVLTPEYSCPWDIIEAIIDDHLKWPLPGKLWALGCESISNEALSQFTTRCKKSNIFFHSESLDVAANRNFYDPLVYLSLCEHQGVAKLLVLVQFKTAHMGSWNSALERNNLIEGKSIWILRNAGDSHCFISVICSEAMNLPTEMTAQKQSAIGWNSLPYYIYHPQANPDPTFADFIAFRKFVLSSQQKEIISLNWNAQSSYKGKHFIDNGSTRSGIYLQISGNELDLSENRVRANHKNGLYYFSFGRLHHAFFVNSEITFISLSETHMLITGSAAPQVRRDGPLALDVEMFDVVSSSFSDWSNKVPDAHIPFLNSLKCGCKFLIEENTCIFEKERLVCISCGQVKIGVTLTDIKTLLTFNMKQDTEANLRITIDDDTRLDSQGKKSTFINAVNTLIYNIIPDKENYPESIRDLKAEIITIGFGPDSKAEGYKHNVVSENGRSKKATLVYMDALPDRTIKQTFDVIQALFDSDNPYKRRVVIFYKRGEKYMFLDDPNAGSITHTNKHDGANILKT